MKAVAEDLTVRLGGTGLPDGEITFDGIAALAEALQLLAVRTGRYLVGQEGRGRTRGTAKRATQLRLRSLGEGSTLLQIAVGEDDVLDDDFERQTSDRLFELFDGMAADQPPAWATQLVGEAAARVLEALALNCDDCEIASSNPRRRPVRLAPARASRAVWTAIAPAPISLADTEVSGVLDLVDLRAARFRVRDDVGNDIALEQVGNAAEAARLVGTRVSAVGEAILGLRGQITRLVSADVTGVQLPGWAVEPAAATAIAGAVSPSEQGVAGVTDEDVDAFLALIRT